MQSGAALFILIAALFLIGVPALAIAAYVNVKTLKQSVGAEAAQLIRRIYALEQRLTQIEKGLESLPAAAAPIPPRETAETAALVAHPPTPAAPPPTVPSALQPRRPSVVSAQTSVPPTPAPVRDHAPAVSSPASIRSEEHTSELQSR